MAKALHRGGRHARISTKRERDAVRPVALRQRRCDEIPVAGADEAVPTTAQLILKVTPHQPGDVRIEGIDLTYRDGLQWGTVHTGTLIEARTD